MADPVTWAVVLSATAAATSAVGTVSAGEAKASAANYQAQIAKNNAVIANQNAEYSLEAGAAQSAAESQKGAAGLSAIKARQAASGLDINSGSAVNVRAGQAETNTLNTLTTEHNALLQAYGYRNQVDSFTEQSALDKSSAQNAKIGGYLSATAGLLDSASSLGFKFSGMQNPGSADDPDVDPEAAKLS